MITGFYAGVLALIGVWLTFDVIKYRRSLKVSIGDGGHDILERRQRIHANFMETVPIALLLMALLELSLAPFWFIHLLGLTLIVGRLMHRNGLISQEAPMMFRVGGMVATIAVIGVAAIANIGVYVFSYL